MRPRISRFKEILILGHALSLFGSIKFLAILHVFMIKDLCTWIKLPRSLVLSPVIYNVDVCNLWPCIVVTPYSPLCSTKSSLSGLSSEASVAYRQIITSPFFPRFCLQSNRRWVGGLAAWRLPKSVLKADFIKWVELKAIEGKECWYWIGNCTNWIRHGVVRRLKLVSLLYFVALAFGYASIWS